MKSVTQYFKEVKELNQVLIKNKQQVRDSEGLDAISENIPESKDLIKLLEQELNLTEIALYNIDGQKSKLGLAYRFGNSTEENHYSYLIYAQNQPDLESFKYYEQFVDCGKSEMIDENWAFSKITVDCNN
jgi:hypothetical protein